MSNSIREVQFWSRVSIRGQNDCWPWLAGKSGGFKYLGESWCHRVAYRLAHGVAPRRLIKRCDLYRCCNHRHYVGYSFNPIDRFWAQVNIGDLEECWEWDGYTEQGYGRIWINGKHVPAHRFSYELEHSPVPSGAIVMHTCDNPPCVNPCHLVAGTHAGNTHDALAKGRISQGQSHPLSKLTEEDILSIISSREISRIVAREFGISAGHVCKIRRREAWNHLEIV